MLNIEDTYNHKYKYADQITLDRIKLLHPSIRSQVENLYVDINYNLPKGVRLRFSQTLRTIEEQNKLYNQGRTTKGKIITNAKGGQSWHNYGLAFDIVLLYDNDMNGTFETASWETNNHWMQVVYRFKEAGYTWGGDFKSFKDY